MMLVAKMFQGVSAEQLRFIDFGFDFESHRCRR
jgi:hypothetical protein